MWHSLYPGEVKTRGFLRVWNQPRLHNKFLVSEHFVAGDPLSNTKKGWKSKQWCKEVTEPLLCFSYSLFWLKYDHYRKMYRTIKFYLWGRGNGSVDKNTSYTKGAPARLWKPGCHHWTLSTEVGRERSTKVRWPPTYLQVQWDPASRRKLQHTSEYSMLSSSLPVHRPLHTHPPTRKNSYFCPFVHTSCISIENSLKMLITKGTLLTDLTGHLFVKGKQKKRST